MMMRRVVALILAFLAVPPVAEAQQDGKVWRIGSLEPGTAPVGWTQHGPGPTAVIVDGSFIRGMKDLGYVEGRDFVMEYRWAEGHPERLPELAAELVRAHVDIIVTGGTPATKAAKQVTKTIPIVFAVVGGAVEKGIVASLARPGGNVTGLSFQAGESKALQLFKETVPTLARVAWLYDPAGVIPGGEGRLQSRAQAIKVEMQFVVLRDPTSVSRAFAEFTRGTDGLLLNWSNPLLLAADQICGLALQRGLPTVAAVSRRFPEAGCLMSYGESIPSAYHRAASYVDKIMKGVKPADLPAEQPTKFELVINMKTAKALGLKIPPSVLLQADQLIQ